MGSLRKKRTRTTVFEVTKMTIANSSVVYERKVESKKKIKIVAYNFCLLVRRVSTKRIFSYNYENSVLHGFTIINKIIKVK